MEARNFEVIFYDMHSFTNIQIVQTFKWILLLQKQSDQNNQETKMGTKVKIKSITLFGKIDLLLALFLTDVKHWRQIGTSLRKIFLERIVVSCASTLASFSEVQESFSLCCSSVNTLPVLINALRHLQIVLVASGYFPNNVIILYMSSEDYS